jgi:hypothetical protein
VLTAGCAVTSGSTPPGEAHPADRATANATAGRRPGVPGPDKGVWFGASVDWAHDSLAAYSRRLGHRPGLAVTFAGFPMSRQEKVWLDQAVDQAKGTGSMLLLTLEPRQGLAMVTSARASTLAKRLARYNREGVPTLVRFAHEMNGSWYPWSQQPAAYIRAFRTLAVAVHQGTRHSAMMWAPNYGGGYPFAGGPHQAEPGSGIATVLDTNGDGAVTGDDDSYRPYWPGRRYVDWVGMSLYHWGGAYPWGENEVPEPGKFVDLLRGRYDGSNGDERAVPDFYAEYGARMRLPVAITETAALYLPGRGGASEVAVKRAWWNQVFARNHPRTLPWLKLINWFEWRKHEPEVGATVDWTVTRDKHVRRAFTKAMPSWLRFAPGPTAH